MKTTQNSHTTHIRIQADANVCSYSMKTLPIHKAKGLATILTRNSIKYSPLLGLLAWSSPNLVSNLRKFPGSTCGSIAKLLFYQREDVKSGRSFGPVSVSKSKSNISSWLSPYSVGSVVGMGTSGRAMNVSNHCAKRLP
jgi:hypothetical protein